jgi:Flp pilus assembly protein TadG
MVFWRKGQYSMAGLGRPLRRFVCDRRGNVAALVALMLVPLVGILGLASEVSTWYTVNRSLQNATDAAAIAAAWNGDTSNDGGGLPRYQREANAVASQYGFVNGANNVTVTPTTVTCPSGSGTCYQVTITRPVPVMLAGVVGFVGNTTLAGGAAQSISAKSIATGIGAPTQFCIVTLGGAGITQPLLINGGPKTDLNGCSTVSNGDATCHGQPIGNIGDSYAIGPTNDCAPAGQDNTISTPVTNPFSGLSSPTNTCPSPNSASSYPQEPAQKKDPPLPNSNLLSGSLSGTVVVCGDAQLTGNLSLNAGTLLVIENGQLDIQNFTLTANQATIVFSGPTIAGLSPSHFPTGSGTMNLTAPTSGTWANVAMYQDASLPVGAGVDINNAGNSPTWNLNGVVVAPNSNVTISGAVNKGVTDCFGLVALTLTINGTGSIANDAACGPITVPGLSSGTVVALVQ